MVKMEEYKIGKATVRVKGRVNKKETQEAINIFMAKVDKQRNEKEKKNEEPLS